MAITRAVGPALAGCELTFRSRESIDIAKAAEQHRTYCDALRSAGISVIVLPADERLPDAVFVEDAAAVLDELAVITLPGSPTRRLEVPAIAEALGHYRQTAHLTSPATMDGGDVLRIGRKIFVGTSSRTNREGFAQFSAIVHRFDYQLISVDVQSCLHLKTAVTALDEETLLLNRHWIDADQLCGFRHVEVPDEEPFAANTLALNGVICLSSESNRTRETLEREGFATRSIDITEFEKAEAGLTCLSLIFQADVKR